VQTYVDDILFGAILESLCKEFSRFMSKEFEMSMMEEFNFFLGLQQSIAKIASSSTKASMSRNS